MMATKSKKTSNYLSYLGLPILLIGLLVSVSLGIYIHSKSQEEDLVKFNFEVQQAWTNIQSRMSRYMGVLIQARAFFLSSDYISRNEFKKYFKNTNLVEMYPGLRGLGLTLRTDPTHLSSHINKEKKTLPTYDVWPHGEREEYFPIVYLEPEDEMNKKAIGYDMFSEDKRRHAMEKARDTGSPMLTGQITLIQEGKEASQPGFNMYVPIYRGGAPINTVEERRNALTGFVYSPFRAHDLFNSIFSETKPEVDIEVFEGDLISAQNLIYDRNDELAFTNKDIDKRFRFIKKMEMNGEIFTLHFYPSVHFVKKSYYFYPVVVGVTSFLITLLLYLIFWIIKRQAEISRVSEERLQKAVRARDDFLSIASHELKTPLTSLKLQAQLIRRSIAKGDTSVYSPEKVKALVEQISRQTLRLERLVDDMLDISRIRTGKLTIEKEYFNLCDLTKDITTRMNEQFKEKPIMSFCEDAIGHWDKIRIEQVITNLLTNAIKYGEEKKIEISVESDARNVYLKVQDQGIGIPDEFKCKIFDRFERAKVAPNEISGLGLGLYITNQIVLSHGGKITIKDAIPKGSIFIVELPRQSTINKSDS